MDASVPLFRQPGDGADTAGHGVQPVLHRGDNLQERPPGAGNSGENAPGEDNDRDGLALSRARAIQGQAQRFRLCAPCGGADSPDAGADGAGSGAAHMGQREEILWDRIKKRLFARKKREPGIIPRLPPR